MKIAVFDWQGKRHLGRLDESAGAMQCFDLAGAAVGSDGVAILISRELPPVTGAVSLAEITLHAPIPRPRRNIFCVGKNYYEHAREFASSGFDSSTEAVAPIIFSKVPESVIATGAPIRIDPAVSTAIDYEAELAVIIGKEGRNIAREEALDYVWGYTIINDVTARDLQGRHQQWLIGKSQDTFCPMGPWACSADTLDLTDTSIRCWVNDELRQDSNTRLLLFDVATIIAAISNGITLKLGDVIATGTPSGVGIGFKPPKYLVPGDRVRIEIDGIGVLENSVEAE